jgi:regulator of replication initiation timing
METKNFTEQELRDVLIAKETNIVLTEDHKYFYGEKELSGITEMIKQFISPNKLDGIDPEVLENARKRGAGIHEALDGLIKNKCSEEMNVEHVNEAFYIYTKFAEQKLTPVASEYIVSDFEYFASPIDVIALNDFGEVCILDLKCTNKLDFDFVRWQTNIYRVFFEKMTGIEVAELFVIHYHLGAARIVPLQKIEDEHVEYMLRCWCELEQFVNPIAENINEDVMLSKTLQVFKAIEALDNEKKQLDAEFEKLKTGLLDLMKANGVKKFENDFIRLTYKEPTTRTSLDSKKLKEEMPDVFDKYKKESEVKESILIKIK